MSKQVWFSLTGNTITGTSHYYATNTNALSRSLKLQRKMTDSQTQNSQGVPRLDLNNQTQSTSDSREDESLRNDTSSPSMHRGFSSDDNSGWKSETTETSEGNLSLSQYPLDDPSGGEESPRDNSIHEEAVTSAITEVSKDFISGNFSPGKYPPIETDSSDGDHGLDGHMGAVYARYPDSATGMSDCDWNPYGTDNDNETPRSSSSDSEAKISRPINTASSIKQEIEIRIPTASNTNTSTTRDFVRIQNDLTGGRQSYDESRLPIAAKDLVKIPSDAYGKQVENRNNAALNKADQKNTYASTSDIDQRSLNREMLNPVPSSRSLTDNIDREPYKSYSPERERSPTDNTEKTSTISTLVGSGDNQPSRQTRNQYIPSSHTDMSYNRRENFVSDRNVVTGQSSSSTLPESINSRRTTETVLSSSSNDPYRREIVGGSGSENSSKTLETRREFLENYGSSGSSQTSQANYLPVGERSKLLGLPEDFPNAPKPSSSTDSAVPRVTDLPLLSRVQIPEKDNIHVSSSNENSESMSKRVSKLLEEASTLGTTLHHHLYSREALGLEGDREPTVLRSFSPMRKSDNFGEKSGERSLTPGSGLMTKSGEQSIRSSLGDEVAKLMLRPEEEQTQSLPNIPLDLNKVPLNNGNIPPTLDQMNAISSQTYPSLAIASGGGGPGSTDSQESADSLSQRVRKILSDTAYVDQMSNGHGKMKYTGGDIPKDFDYSRLQRDLQDIQNSLDPVADYDKNINPSPDMSKTSDKSVESTKSHKLLWDHGADLGYDDSLSGRFLGTMKTDTETECESTYSGKGYGGLSDTLELVGKSRKDTDVVSDQVESDLDDNLSGPKLAPDVEEIIRRYQTEKPDSDTMLEAGDSSGLASRVMKILSKEPPRKQAYGILESARQEENEMIQKLAEKPKLDSSVESQSSPNGSFVIRDKDVRKQLEWSEMSGIDKSINSSYLSGIKNQPFSALGNAQTFLSSQLAKNADRTFNHSIDLRTPYRHVIDCYPVYGAERTRGAADVDQFGRTEPDGVKEAWPDQGPSIQDIPTDQLLGATSDGTANVRPGSRDHQRTFSDPRELSPESKTDSTLPLIQTASPVAMETENGHTRSKSEEPQYGEELPRDRFYNLESSVSTSSRRMASSPHGEQKEKDTTTEKKPTDVVVTTPPSAFRRPRLKNYSSFLRSYRDTSPGSGGQISPDSEGSSTRRREAARLRPYRPHGSRELYYTEDGEDSMAESITTVESNHTGQRRVTWNPITYKRGSDDAIGPSFPPQFLGSRKDSGLASGGIYGSRTVDKKDTLSTIDEKSLAQDDREKSGTDSGVDNPRSDLGSSHGSNLSSYRRETTRHSHEDFPPRNVGQSDEKLMLSTRSDPGDQYATPKRSTRYHDRSDPRSDSCMYRESSDLDRHEPKPVKSRSETDLATLPDVDRKYSSPMHGDRFMELSNQPSPIYSHHTSMASPAVFNRIGNHGADIDAILLQERLNVKPLEKGSERSMDLSQRESADGMNTNDKPGSTPYNKAYKSTDSVPSSSFDRRQPELVGSLEPGYSRSEPVTVYSKPESSSSNEIENPRMEVDREGGYQQDVGQRENPVNVRDREPVRPLDRGPDYGARSIESGQYSVDINTNPPPHVDIINPGSRPTDRMTDYLRGTDANEMQRERRNLEKGPNYYDIYGPRRERASHRMIIDDDTEELEFKELPRRSSTPYECPDADFEEMVREEKHKVQIEYELQRRLKQKGYMQTSTDEKEFGAEYDHVPPNERAKSLQRKLEQESHKELPPNINDLWQKFQEMNQNESTSSLNSSRMGAITDLLKNPTKHIVQKITDERTYEKAKERRIMQELNEKAREEQRKDTRSERKRQEMQNLRRLSEEESNGSYAEILQQEQKKKQLQGKHKKPSSNQDRDSDVKQKKELENKMKGSKKAKIDIPVHGDSIDTLYSIPEDASFEVTPSKAEESNTSKKKSRQRHVIDPLMSKLKDKIETQRLKIDKERRKEMKRLEKLKKLEMLLTAKKKGKLSDQAIDVELQYVSSTSAATVSESSTLFGSETTLSADSANNNEIDDSQEQTVNTTSTKDSSIEIQRVRTKKTKQGGMLDAYMASIGQIGRGDDSGTSTDDLQIVRKMKSSKPGKGNSEKKKKDKKNKSENHQKINSEVDFNDEPNRNYELQRRERSKSPKSRRLKDASTMVPSPIVKSPVSRRKVRDVYVRSEAVQTSPSRSWSPAREEQAVISVPLMSPTSKRKVKTFDSRQQRLKDYSLDDSHDQSSVLSRSVSPPARSKSVKTGRQSTRSKSPPKPRIFLPETESEDETKPVKVSPPPKSRMFTPETPDDDLAGKIKDNQDGGLTWFVPMAESKPWRKPLKERQAFAVSQEPWQPKSVSSSNWKAIVADNPVNKSIGESTQFDLDTTGHFKEFEEERSDEENFDPKPLSRLTLQDAFKMYKQDTISKLRARQKRVALAAEERHLQEMLEKERNTLFSEQKRQKEANPEAHPLSENLHKPKRRAMSKGEMKELTQKLYKKLPEVQNQKLQQKRQEDYSLNRLRAKVFNRKIQNNTLKKVENRRKRSPSKNIP